MVLLLAGLAVLCSSTRRIEWGLLKGRSLQHYQDIDPGFAVFGSSTRRIEWGCYGRGRSKPFRRRQPTRGQFSLDCSNDYDLNNDRIVP